MKKKWLYLDLKNDLKNNLEIKERLDISLEQFIFRIKKNSEKWIKQNPDWGGVLDSLINLDLPSVSSLSIWSLTNELKGYHLAIDLEGNVFVDSFFFHAITSETKEEVTTYLIYVYITLNHLLPDLEIACFELEKEFLKSKSELFDQQEYDVLFNGIFDNKSHNQIHLFGLIFVTLVHSYRMSEINAIEKSIVREYIGKEEIKKILGFDEDDYLYMENPKFSGDQIKQADKISAVIDEEQISIEDYVKNAFGGKKILLWNWWTISPFLIKDISIFLNLLSQYKKIKKIYIDLPQNISPHVQNYLRGATTEKNLEPFVKQVYPSFLKDYVKEITPYLIVLDRVKTLFSTFFKQDLMDSEKNKKVSDEFLNCFGLKADEFLEYLPLVNKENKIYFEIEQHWYQLFLKEWQSCVHYDEDEIVIFIQAMKPMLYLPNHFNNISENNPLVRLLHADKFTGFGREKPENFLALYSQYHGYKKQSFVLPNLKKHFFSNDIILPLNDRNKKNQSSESMSNAMVIDDSKFNHFSLYDTLLYSNHHSDGHSSFVENDFKRDLVFG